MADTPATPQPDSFDDIATDDLVAKVAELRKEFTEKYDSEAPLAELNELAESIEKIDAELEQRELRAAADAAEREELAKRIAPVADEATDEIETEAAEVEVVEEAEAVVAEAAEATTETDEVSDTEERELVTASAKRPSASAVARRTATPTAPAVSGPELVITAAADVPGYANGQNLDRVGIAKAMHARARGLGDSAGKSARFSVASIESPIPDEFKVSDGTVDATDAVIRAAVESQLAGKDAAALVASGGWCAPSEVLYDLFSVESRDGLLDLPTIGVSRGGIQYPAYIGLDAAASGLWTWTEQNDITPGTPGPSTKACVKIPCPTFTDCRLTAEGLCITHGNLSDRAYPELTARFVDLAITAHLHKLSTAQIAAIVGGATSVTVTSTDSDAAGDILGAIDLQVADYRSQFMMGLSTVLDAVFPAWFVEAIRATLAMRAGVESYAVSNAEVISFFTARNVRPQFVQGFEPLYDTSPATAFPATGKFLLMPAGGYVIADGGTLDLGVVRDSTLNETNDFTAAWTEQFYCVIQRGPAAREVTVTTDVDGVTACCPTV